MTPQITVVGAGVIGLTSAVVFAEAGYSVQIISEEFSPNTTSDVAGALWYPSAIEPRQLTRSWYLTSLRKFQAMANDPLSGCRLVEGERLFYRRMGFPWWRDEVSQFEALGRTERNEPRTIYRCRLPVIEMPKYLSYLEGRCRNLGVTLRKEKIDSFDSFEVVVNCTGLGAKSLANDSGLYAVRGQTVEVAAELNRWVTSTDYISGAVYCVPRSNSVILAGASEMHNLSLDLDEAQTQKIFNRCCEVVPSLKDCEILSANVGLRPARKSVCTDVVKTASGLCFHNYGHGRAGVSLSWGTAYHCLELFKNFPC